MKPYLWVFLAASMTLLCLGGCGGSEDESVTTGGAALDPVKIFGPALPARFDMDENPTTQEKIDLGRMLYYEPRMSMAKDISCNTCHLLDNYGVDGLPTSKGFEGQKGSRNAPTVYNAAGHISQFWDGRAKDVEEQAKGPILNPVEMAMPAEAEVVATLKGIDGYVAAFGKAFPGEDDPVTYDNMAKAIGVFERGLLTPSRFDRFLGGDKTALTEAEQKGLDSFMKLNCIMCHSGNLVGGRMYNKAGLVKPWPNQEDVGRSAITGNEQDKMFFKVPSLRNIAKTGPYFHDGSVSDLKEAVRMMAHHQLGLELTAEQIDEIIAFLNALTGDVPAEYTRKPQLP